MASITEENIIKILGRLGLPGNAAKVYIFLLKNGPSTGYSVSKKSGVNNAVVYREIERLKSKNFVYQLGGGKPLKYDAINSHGLIKILKRQNNLEEALLESSLKSLLKKTADQISVKITEYGDFIEEVKKQILSAKKRILIRLWSDELSLLEDDLRKMEKRKIDIQLLSFTTLENPIGETFSYNVDPNSFKENWQRGLALFVDDSMVIVGNKIGKYPIQGLLTNDLLISESIRDQILLDVELVKTKMRGGS